MTLTIYAMLSVNSAHVTGLSPCLQWRGECMSDKNTFIKPACSHPCNVFPSYNSTRCALCWGCQDNHWPLTLGPSGVDSTKKGAKQPSPSSSLGSSAICSLDGAGHCPRPLARFQQLHSLEECLKLSYLAHKVQTPDLKNWAFHNHFPSHSQPPKCITPALSSTSNILPSSPL